LTLFACYLTEALLVSFNISKAKIIVSNAKQIVSLGKQHVLTCRAMLKCLSRGSEQPENRGDLGKNRRNGGMFSKM